ncbi:TPA: hypothetical protein RG395_002351 [Legionella pneumophila]|nr:hypothetical protein [Legionella pneumophila]MDW8962923.1 hypothetical protein [Legionella pneumophila subsp. fraseri]MDW9063161.1 hypothetical protein [Legionella pneumophila subsp. fraseri]HBC1993232.1 hypothetical protein [Legionella pneumophila]HBC2756948.1 hypothetical protein [Legionella pneumophila]HBD7249704.1 hypothetical protein [Legionella pneumophila]
MRSRRSLPIQTCPGRHFCQTEKLFVKRFLSLNWQSEHLQDQYRLAMLIGLG